MEDESFQHLNPVWSEHANFIIGIPVPGQEQELTRWWEQLWSRQLSENRFELCCIPFFVYDLALGDEVETAAEKGKQYMIQRVVRPSGHFTLRIWFGEVPDVTARTAIADETLRDLHRLGCLMEFYSENLLGVSVPPDRELQTVLDYLSEQEQVSQLTYETGYTH